jgi:hypothetical protein
VVRAVAVCSLQTPILDGQVRHGAQITIRGNDRVMAKPHRDGRGHDIIDLLGAAESCAFGTAPALFKCCRGPDRIDS